MTSKEFIKAISNGEVDLIQVLLDILKQGNIAYCVIGGLAVNSYVEPVVSLDLDLVVIAKDIELVCQKAKEQDLKVERFAHSINLSSSKSDLRIQLQTDARYQDFIPGASEKKVLGYNIQVAQLKEVLHGKVWAYQDETRRKSKRQKDLADIARIIEADPELISSLPYPVLKLIE